jgi:hypothetical protein
VKRGRMSNQTKTIGELQTNYSEAEASQVSAWYARIDEIAAERLPEGGELLDYMTSLQKEQLLRDRMEETLDRERARRVEEAQARFERFRREHDRRVAQLDARLYHVEGADRMVADAVRASDEDLARMLEAAVRTNSSGLAKVVFAEAERRGGLPQIMERYYSEVDPEARELLEERHQAMSPEDLEWRRASVETMFHRPDLSSLLSAQASARASS